MSAVSDPRLADRLAKICGMFGSAHDGERAAAAALADNLIRSAGLTWHDVINLSPKPPSVDWQIKVERCRIGRLWPREQQFIETLLRWRGRPTEKQLKWLGDIYLRVATSC